MASDEIGELPQEGVKITEVDGERTMVIRMPDGTAVARPLKTPVGEKTEKEA